MTAPVQQVHPDASTTSGFRLLTTPSVLLLLALGIDALSDARIATSNNLNWIAEVTSSLVWAAGAFLVIRVVEAVVWRQLLEARGVTVPRVLRELVIGLIWYWAACGVVSFVFGQSLTAIVTASTVAMGIIGFALQRPILDAFSGVVLALQRPFKLGDWLVMDEKGTAGRVVEMNWRAVHLQTPDEITFVIPNGQFVSSQTKIYSRPEKFFRDEIQVTLPFSVTTHQGRRILLGAANQVDEIAALPRKSIVSIVDYTDRGVLWRLLYWCPDPGRIPVFRFQVHQNILRNLHYANIEVPAPIRDLRRLPRRPDASEDGDAIDPLIQRLPLFAGLTASELRRLSADARPRLVAAGVPLLRQGDDGRSLFILRDGVLDVKIAVEHGGETVVARINPGDFFGEMSLLLGEPRTATIVPVVDSMVVEITYEAMQALMVERPDLAVYLAEVLAERRVNAAGKLAAATTPEEQGETLLDNFIARIRSAFGISRPRAPAEGSPAS